MTKEKKEEGRGRRGRETEGRKERKKKEGWTSHDRYRSRHHPVDKGCSAETAKSGFVGFAGTRYTWPRFASFHASTHGLQRFLVPRNEKENERNAREEEERREVRRSRWSWHKTSFEPVYDALIREVERRSRARIDNPSVNLCRIVCRIEAGACQSSFAGFDQTSRRDTTRF